MFGENDLSLHWKCGCEKNFIHTVLVDVCKLCFTPLPELLDDYDEVSNVICEIIKSLAKEEITLTKISNILENEYLAVGEYDNPQIIVKAFLNKGFAATRHISRADLIQAYIKNGMMEDVAFRATMSESNLSMESIADSIADYWCLTEDIGLYVEDCEEFEDF